MKIFSPASLLLVGLHSPACPRRVAPHRCSPLCQGLKKAEQRACTEQLQEQKELLNSIKRELQTAQRPLEAGTLQQVVTSLQDASSSLEALAEQSLSSSSSSSSSESECEEMDPLAATRAQIAEAATLQEHISPSVQAELPTAEPSASGRVMVSFSPDGGVSLAGTPEHAVGQVRVCQGKTCSKRGAGDVLMQLGEQAAAVPGIEVAACKCLDRCKVGRSAF